MFCEVAEHYQLTHTAPSFPVFSAPEFRAFGYLGDADQGETQVLDPSQDAVEVGLVDDVAADEGLAVPALQGHPFELRSEPLAKLAFDGDPVPSGSGGSSASAGSHNGCIFRPGAQPGITHRAD